MVDIHRITGSARSLNRGDIRGLVIDIGIGRGTSFGNDTGRREVAEKIIECVVFQAHHMVDGRQRGLGTCDQPLSGPTGGVD